jgi:hypothetical protein
MTSCAARCGRTSRRRRGRRPVTGKVAIKVINHYGDEVMKVYAV